MAEMAGKGWRVLGYFVWMLGAGIVLDSDAWGIGGALLAVGAGLFVFGAVRSGALVEADS